MKLELDLKVLKESKLSPNLYVYLYLLFNKDNFKLTQQDCTNLAHVNDLNINFLEELGFIKIGEDSIYLRETAFKLFEISKEEAAWLEFKGNYPIKSGERRLHNKQDECKKKYLAIIK